MCAIYLGCYNLKGHIVSILVTGSLGFIDANLVLQLLHDLPGGNVINLDNMNGYYEPAIKQYHLALIQKFAETAKAVTAIGVLQHSVLSL